ncbi:MAG TPA: family 1 encapsulin nanocompartment shell protein, partial [Candidatus Cryosericum sp.]|nr:family 1 encapsulin nanocompartment shell protein [Candidatus Cryosericum sp.]
GHVVVSPALGTGKAVLVCSEPENMDLVVGQDMTTAFLEQSSLNTSLRVLETVLLRIRRRQAVVVLG